MSVGKHIVTLLIETNAMVENGDRWLVVKGGLPLEFIVYEKKAYQKKTRILIETENEEEACQILKGEKIGIALREKRG